MTTEQSKEIEEIVSDMRNVQIKTGLFGAKQTKEFKEMSDEDKAQALLQMEAEIINDKDHKQMIKEFQLQLYAAALSGL